MSPDDINLLRGGETEKVKTMKFQIRNAKKKKKNYCHLNVGQSGLNDHLEQIPGKKRKGKRSRSKEMLTS